MTLRFAASAICLFVALAFVGSSPGFGQEAASSAPVEAMTPVSRGFVFVDGVYLPPPYQFEVLGDAIKINDKLVQMNELNLESFIDWDENSLQLLSKPGSLEEALASLPKEYHHPMWNLSDSSYANLLMNGSIVITRGHAPLLLDDSGSGHELLSALLSRSKGNADMSNLVGIPSRDFSDSERKTWDDLINRFQSSPEFVSRAHQAVADVLAANASSERISMATLWADNIAYPLTLFAMIVVVVAFGHLLQHKPCLETAQGDSEVSPETRKVVLKSLLIFGLLSAVDLIWTIVANSTGSMREMNPLGNGLIHNPLQLILFKTCAVTVTISLLYALHHRPIAQMASWWSCLVLTLLTARWLTFNSMFM